MLITAKVLTANNLDLWCKANCEQFDFLKDVIQKILNCLLLLRTSVNCCGGIPFDIRATVDNIQPVWIKHIVTHSILKVVPNLNRV